MQEEITKVAFLVKMAEKVLHIQPPKFSHFSTKTSVGTHSTKTETVLMSIKKIIVNRVRWLSMNFESLSFDYKPLSR